MTVLIYCCVVTVYKYIIQIRNYTAGWPLSRTIQFNSHACTVKPYHILTIDKATLKKMWTALWSAVGPVAQSVYRLVTG